MARLTRPSKRALKFDASKHLWMVNHYAVSKDMPGGTRHIELAQLLHSHGWAASIFATPFNYTTHRFMRSITVRKPFLDELLSGVPFYWSYSAPYKRNNWRRYLNMISFTLFFIVRAVRLPAPTIVVGSSPHPFAALGAWGIARWHHRPFILEVRDVWPETLVQMGLKNPAIVFCLSMLERFLYARATLIITLTQGISDLLETKGVPRSKLRLIPNSPSSPKPLCQGARDLIRKNHGWEDKIVVMYAGAHGPANDLERAVEAAKLIRDDRRILFVFVGDGPAKQALRAKALDIHNVILLDPVSKNEIGELLRAADIAFLGLRQAEVFKGARPNKLFDYMAAALPIVSTIGGEAWEIVKEAGAGLYAEEGESSSIAAAVLRLADNDNDRRSMGRRGYEYARQIYSREDAARDLCDAITEISRVEGLI